MNDLPFHEVANLFPLMDGAAFKDLKADVAANGLREPVWTWQGAIIDGRNRYRACRELGIEPTFREWDGNGSLVAFVVSMNLHRRHLTADQKRAVIAALLKAEPKSSNRKIASEVGADHKTVQAVREGLTSTGEIPQLDRTRGRDGRERAATKRERKAERQRPAPVPDVVVEADEDEGQGEHNTGAQGREDDHGGDVRPQDRSATGTPSVNTVSIISDLLADGQWCNLAWIRVAVEKAGGDGEEVAAALKQLQADPPPGRLVEAKCAGGYHQYRLRTLNADPRSIAAGTLLGIAEGVLPIINELDEWGHGHEYQQSPVALRRLAEQLRRLMVPLTDLLPAPKSRKARRPRGS